MLVAPAAGQTVVYWGTPQGKAALAPSAWPQGYRERSEKQAHSFKRMLDQGALNTTYGRKKIAAPDRPQQRQREQRDQTLAAAQQRLDKQAAARKEQQAKGAESEAKGPGTRLAQPQRTLAVVDKERKDAPHKHARLAEHAAAVGAPGKRAERDFRTQTIMTMRTLLLENALRACMVVLLGALQTPVSVEGLLRLLFERSGACMETDSQGVSWINTAGVSLPYRRLLAEVIEGLGAMELQAQGKPMRVRLRDMPP